MGSNDTIKGFLAIAAGVIAAVIAVKLICNDFSHYKHFINYWNWGDIIGSVVSAFFLFALGNRALNGDKKDKGVE